MAKPSSIYKIQSNIINLQINDSFPKSEKTAFRKHDHRIYIGHFTLNYRIFFKYPFNMFYLWSYLNSFFCILIYLLNEGMQYFLESTHSFWLTVKVNTRQSQLPRDDICLDAFDCKGKKKVFVFTSRIIPLSARLKM
jgi:hypothetical protein